MVITAQELKLSFSPPADIKCLDEDYCCPDDVFMDKVIKEYTIRCRWQPLEAKWWIKLFVKDMKAWSKKNDCEDHAFRFQQAARDYHYWSNNKGRGIAVGVIAITNHALNVVRYPWGLVYLDRGKRVLLKDDIIWGIF